MFSSVCSEICGCFVFERCQSSPLCLKQLLRAAQQTEAMAVDGRDGFQFMVICRALVPLCSLCVCLGIRSTALVPAGAGQGQAPAPPVGFLLTAIYLSSGTFGTLFVLFVMLGKSCPLWAWRESGMGGVLLGFLSLSGTINLFYPIVFTGLSPEFDPSSVILQ